MPMDRQPPSPVEPTRAHRVIASLNREQVDFLDKVGKDALFSAGVKLSRTQILAAMVNVLKQSALTGNGIRTPEELERRIVEMLSKSRMRSQHELR